MQKCDHKFIGLGTGVQCTRCGLAMTTQQYRDYLAAEKKPKKASAQRKKKTDEQQETETPEVIEP